MNISNYIKNNGFIYGISSKYTFGWEHVVYVFDNEEAAVKWLHTEEYDFRERELMSKSKAIRIAGKSLVDKACLQEVSEYGL